MSKMIFKPIAIILLIIGTSMSGFCQTDTLIWQSDTVKNILNSDVFAFNCLFKVYPNEKIEWIQNGGAEVSEFIIESSTGELPENGIGTVEYSIAQDGLAGRIKIQRVAMDKTELILDLSENPNGAHYIFNVSHN